MMTTETDNQNSNGDIITPKSAIARIAEQSGCRISDLLTLSPQNDPYNSGSKGDVEAAEWFADLWHRLEMRDGSHIRKLHYKMVSGKEEILKPDGEPYLNTENSWSYLEKASKHARFLGLIDPRKLKDRRNPEPRFFAPELVKPGTPIWSIEEYYGFTVPSISSYMQADFDIPEIGVDGYSYDEGEQKYVLELWVEKSTMNDEVTPVCEEYGINLVTSLGFQSISSAIAVLSRADAAIAMGRPVRIFYVSDYDPAGHHMPIAISRQLQFWHDQFGSSADIKLTPLVLTRDQVAEYELPRKPIKDSDLRKKAFEECHGEGAVELDALEAIFPGELDRIIREAASQYRDTELPDRLQVAEAEAEQQADERWISWTSDTREKARNLEERMDEVVQQYQPALQELSEEFDTRMEPLQKEADDLEEEMRRMIDLADEVMDLELPERPVIQVEQPDESKWLFDSNRSYGEQVRVFNLHKEGSL